MKSIEAIIERASDGTYSVYCKDEMFTGMGDTPELAKQNMMEQMQFFKEIVKKMDINILYF
jgi:predicted RNase H-like HicB family nuclease